MISKYKIIDYWVNPFWTEAVAGRRWENPETTALEKGRTSAGPARVITPEEYIQVMDSSGVEKIFVPAWKRWSYRRQVMTWDVSVEEVARVLGKYPDRFRGLYGINPYSCMKGVKELEIAVKEYGFVGAHLHPYGYGKPVNCRDYYPFYAKCVELDVPLVVQTGNATIPAPNEMGRPIPYLEEVVLYFHELRIVAAHTGWPWADELISLSLKYPNVYIGTSAYLPKYWDTHLVHYMNTRGIGKVLFGTGWGWPRMEYEAVIQQIEALGLKEEAKHSSFSEVARKVFKI